MSGIGSAFEISAKEIRNSPTLAIAMVKISERLAAVQKQIEGNPTNTYLKGMRLGYSAAFKSVMSYSAIKDQLAVDRSKSDKKVTRKNAKK